MDIIEEIQNNQVDYNALKEKCYIRLVDTRAVDVSIIIPVHGRTQFNKAVTNNFKTAIDYYNATHDRELKVSITIVEHHHERQHDSICEPYVNYIHIPQENHFRKTLAFNVGALFSNKVKDKTSNTERGFYLLQDVDTFTQSPDFFHRALININRGCIALQCFRGQRLIHANEAITLRILMGKDHVGNCYDGSRDATLAVPGAPGGSIMVEKETFIRVGMADEHFKEYSVEDSMLWHKLSTVGKLGLAEYPPIEQVHLWHPPSFSRITSDSCWAYYNAFLALSHEDKLRYMDIKSNHIKKFIS